MATDIVPIRLSLTEGDLVTLWAPRWREDGEEWEAFLGDEDDLFAFAEVAQLAAFVRTVRDHDLVDHPAWPDVPGLSVAELTPDETHDYDVIGVPELVAHDPDTWTIAELAEIIAMVRTVADVCGLDRVTEILDTAPGLSMLEQGTLPFVGREGQRLWGGIVKTVADGWDDVIDVLDGLVATPELDAAALADARAEEAELAEREEAAVAAAHRRGHDPDTDAVEDAIEEQVELDEAEQEAERPLTFWDEVGIDPIRITIGAAEHVTLRCYLGDEPVFYGAQGRVTTFPTERALARHLADGGLEHHDLTAASTWDDVLAKASVGELDVSVAELNTYVLTGIDDDIAEGIVAVDPTQLDLAVELLFDVGDWAGDDEAREALAESEALGWLVSFVIRPDPTRLAPGPPYDAEALTWRGLVLALERRLDRR